MFDEEWLGPGERVRGNFGKDKGLGWGESKTRDGCSDVDRPFEAAFAGERDMSRRSYPDRIK